MSESTYSQRYSSSDSSTAGAFAFDTISAKDYAVSKLAFGAVGSVTYVSASDPLPVTFSGTVTVTGDSGGSLTVDAPVATPVFVRLSDGAAAITALPVTDNSGSLTVDGTVAATQSGTWNVGTVTTITNVVHIDDNSSTISVDDGGGSLTVDGSVSISGTVTVASHAVTNAGTFAVQVDGAALTSLQLIDDTVFTLGTDTYAEATSKGLGIGAVRRDADTTLVNTTNEWGPLQMDANGRLKVEVFSGETLPVSLTSTTITGTVAVTQSGTWDEVGINDSGNSITVDNGGTFVVQENGAALTALQLIDDIVYTDDTSTHSTGSSKGALFMAAATPTDASVNANDIGAVAMTTDRKLHVSVQDSLPAGTNGIGKLTSNSGVTIGAVEIAAAQTLATVTTVTTCSTVTTVSTLTGGAVAHDSGDSGNPIKVGARAALTLSDDTMVANADRTDNVSDADGALLVRKDFPLGDLISERVSNTDGASTAFSNFGATANTRNYVTCIVVYNSSATNGYIDFRDGTGGSILYTVPIPTVGGCVIAQGGSPLFRTTANTALAFDVSAALSTVYISITGYKSKV